MPIELTTGWYRPYIVWGILLILCSIPMVNSLSPGIINESKTALGSDFSKSSIILEENSKKLDSSLKTPITALHFGDEHITEINIQPTPTLSTNTEPDWPMFGKDNTHSHESESVMRGIYEPSIKWDIWPEGVSGLGLDSWGTTIGNFSANIEWTGGAERNVKHVVYADNGFINILDGETGDYVWRLNADLIDSNTDGDLIYTTPTLGYFNNNNKQDIIFGTTDGILYMYEPKSRYNPTTGYENSTDNINSDKKWQFSTNKNFTHSSPVLLDLDYDDYLDIVVGADDNLFAVSGNTGDKLWNQTLPGNIISSPAVYEDGMNDFYIAATALNPNNLEYSANFFRAESGVRTAVLNYNLSLFPIPNMIPSPATGELDNDDSNFDELIICTPFEGPFGNGRVYVYHANRSLLWSTPENAIIGQIEATPAIGDLDGDGLPEIIVVSWNQQTPGSMTHVYAFHGKNGTQAWHITKDTYGSPPFFTNERAIGSPILADVNVDNNLDVIFATSPNVYAVNGATSDDLWDIGLSGSDSGRELWTTPAAGDFDNDGFLDVMMEGATISHVIIDLTISNLDLSFSSENITENQPVTLKAITHNNGSATARDIKVSFFEDDALIGNGSITSIPAKDTREVRLDWTPTEEGEHILKIIIDPENEIEEILEDNNELTKLVNVIPSYPDLIIDTVKYYREDGKESDNNNTHLIENENSTIDILVKNIGGDEGRDIKIRILISEIQIVEDMTISKIIIQEIIHIAFTWNFEKGIQKLTVLADPMDTITEVNETNNEYIEELQINSKTPANPIFACTGIVHQPEGADPAVGIPVLFTNNRTQAERSTNTNETGYYSFDLGNLPDNFQEGDEIFIFVSDGENESSIMFKAYSEDQSRFDNITLVKVPTYAITISVDDDSKNVLPNNEIQYYLTITNRGNEDNTVNLSKSEIKDVQTGLKAEDWEAQLNDYMIEHIPAKSSKSGIVLTIRAPSKAEDARANTQVLIAVTAKSIFDPEQIDIVGMTTTVERIYDFIITVENPNYSIDPLKNQSASFDVKIKNNGNDDDTVTLNMQIPSGWQAEYPSSLDLALGKERAIDIILTTEEESLDELQYTFILYVSSIDKKGNVSENMYIDINRPDLGFKYNVTMTPQKPSLSTNISFDAVIQNDGTTFVNAFLVAFRVRGIDLEIKPVYNLSAGDWINLNFDWTPLELGYYLIEIEIDPYNDVAEVNENNNLLSLELDFYIDLELSEDVEFSNDKPMVGDEITISVTITNNGNVDLSDEFAVKFYDGDPEEDGRLIEEYVVSKTLEMGNDLEISIDWIADGGNQEHTIHIEVNPGHDIIENNYNNNLVKEIIFVSEKSKEIKEDTTDYTLWIILIFFVGIIIILFLVFTPAKQPITKRKKRDISASRGKSGKRNKPRSISEEDDFGRVEPLTKERPDVKASKKGVKFILVGEEPKDVDEIEDEEDEDEDEDRISTGKKARSGRAKRKSGVLDSVSGLLAPLFGGKRKRRPIRDPSRRKTEKRELPSKKRPTVESPSKAIEVKEVEEEGSEEEVIEVEVISEDETDDGIEVEELEEDEEDEPDAESESKDKKRKSDTGSGWDYSQMIGIR